MAHFAKMIDMAKTPEEVNKEVKNNSYPMSAQATADNVAKYPYGLCITLEKDQLDKLEIDGDCEVGDMIHLCAMAKVTNVSSREKEGGTDTRIELQITHLATDSEDEENAETMSSEHRAKKRYGGNDAKETDVGEGDEALEAGDYKAA